MSAPTSDLPSADLPRPAVYVTGVTCGILVAIVVEILLSHAGIKLLFSAQGLQVRSAGAWWLMAGSAFLTGAGVVAALSRLPLPWHRFRLLRWLLGAAVVFALAEVGRMAAEADGHRGGAFAAVMLAALLSCLLMSLFGAYFASKR